MKTILIAGSTGFIGRYLVEALKLQKKFKIIGTYYKNKPKVKFKNVSFIKIDLRDPNQIEKKLGKVDYIINLAGVRDSFLEKKESQNQIIDNTKIVYNLCEHAKITNCKNFIFISSVYIYSGSGNEVFKENQKLNFPKEPLGISKFISECIIKQYNFRAISLRVFTVYGKGANLKQFIEVALKKIKDKSKKIYFGNKNIKRDFIFIDDVVDGIIKSINLVTKVKKFESFNLCTGHSLSIENTISIIQKELNTTKKVIFDNITKLRAGDVSHMGDNKKTIKFLKWKAIYSFEKGFQKMIK